MNSVEKRLKRAVEGNTPDVFDKVLHRLEEREKENIMITFTDRQSKLPNQRPWLKWASAAAVIAVVAFGSYNWYSNNTVESIIGFDVNPSVELDVNKAEKVLTAKALNTEGETVLKGMDLKSVHLDVAVNAIIGSMFKNGFVDEVKNSILISVENPNSEKSIALQSRLSSEVSGLLNAYSVNGAVLTQTISEDSRLLTLANEHGISLGKAALVDLLVSHDSRLNFSDMAKLPINDLSLLITSKDTSYTNLALVGNSSSQAYIGVEKAKTIALDHAEVSAADAEFRKAKLDWDDGRMVYDLEFMNANYEYDYEIDALNGQILEFDKDPHRSAPGNQWNPTPTRAPAPTRAPEPSTQPELIGEARAKEIALNHAGLKESDVTGLRVHLDRDDRITTYDVEFRKGRIEYDYEINAATGDIIEWDSDYDD